MLAHVPPPGPAADPLDDLDAAFDSVVFLEDAYTTRGREFGETEGARRGRTDGFLFGWVSWLRMCACSVKETVCG